MAYAPSTTSTNPGPALSFSARELAGWQQDGFVIRRRVFSEPELVALRNAAEAVNKRVLALCESEGAETYYLDGNRFVDIKPLTVQFEHTSGSQTVRVVEPVQELHPLLDRLVDDPRLTGPIASLLDVASLSLWTAKMNFKRGRQGSGFGWHQDSPYWVHDSKHVDLLPNVFLNFDDATLSNGCLQIIRGSHKAGCLPGTNNGRQLGGFFTDPACFDEADAVALEVPAGSLVFFSPHAIHGSGPNRSDEARRAIILTYQPPGFPTLKRGTERPVPLQETPDAGF